MTTEQQVKTQDFSEAEARRTTIRMILKGETKGDPVLLAAFLEAQEEEITQLKASLKYMGEALGAFKTLVSKAAWTLGVPAAANLTGADEMCQLHADGECSNHFHALLSEDARQAFAALARLDTSGYAPCRGTAPDGGSNAAHPLFGYARVSGGYDSAVETPCVHCGEPASEHPCPAVPS
jgi:hypothetical protein